MRCRWTNHLPNHIFEFGASQLWIDRVDGMSQAEIWLEFVVDDVPAASKHLCMNEIIQRNEIEPLPEGFDGFWIPNPAFDHSLGLEASPILDVTASRFRRPTSG